MNLTRWSNFDQGYIDDISLFSDFACLQAGVHKLCGFIQMVF
jgi:hypothetical protein